MSTLNDRIKEIRKELDLSQKDFSKRLGISQRAVSWSEQPGNNVPDSTIKAVSMAFNVNEEWLRTGTGEKFNDLIEDEFSKAAAMLSDDPFVRGMIIEYWKLDEDSRQLFRNFIERLAENMRGQK